MDFSVILLLGLLLIIALLIPWFEGLLKNSRNLLIAILALALAFAARAWFLDYASGDYDTFLVHWVDYYRTNGGFAGLANSLGNYNIPYLYFLALFSYLPINDLYLIKLLSIAFDIILAFSMMKLTGVFTRSVTKRLAAFLITLLLPTVVLNGAMWGQCDSIYVAFALLSLWLVLSDRPKLSMVFMALSFGFKLQAIFLMPVFLVMLFAKKIKFRQLFVFPLAYIALILPAVLLGRPFMDAITLYFNQAGSIGSYLNYNSPSIFAFFQNGDNTALSAAFIALALLF
ncbi:MAG: conjugal transfer protein TraL, partial [Oscillospiraceae bacterium]